MIKSNTLKKLPNTLERRVVSTFVIITTIIAATFSLSIFFTIYFVEGKLISSELDRQLNQRLEGYQPKLSPRAQYQELFFAQGDPTIPAWVVDINSGFSEVFVGDKSYHAWAKDIGGKRYYILSDQSEFERYERILLGVVALGFILSVFFAWIIAKSSVRNIIEPVIKLSQEVQGLENIDINKEFISDHYANDEIGMLAKAFDGLISRYHQALQRERLFSADVSHELRTPTMVISSSCELLLAKPTLNEKERTQVRKILEASQEIKELCNTFLMLLRNEYNNSTNIQMLSTELLDDLCANWSAKIKDKDLEFSVQLTDTKASTLPKGPTKILLDNLLRNALKNTEKGRISVCFDGSILTIEDTGSGLNEAHKNTIFKPFQTLSLNQESDDSFGLGLSITERICQSQNWKIDYELLGTGGTRFIVTL